MMIRFIPVLAATLVSGAAVAQNSYSPEAFAVVKPGENADFNSDTVRTLGELTRFEVTITRRGMQEPQPGGPAERQVRYVAKCASGELTLAAVSLIDDSGRVMKTMTIPPGAGEFTKPEAGSQEAQWLAKACGRN